MLTGSVPRAQAMVKEYSDEEHDFGVDYNVVASLTKLSPEDAKSIISALAKSETGMYELSIQNPINL